MKIADKCPTVDQFADPICKHLYQMLATNNADPDVACVDLGKLDDNLVAMYGEQIPDFTPEQWKLIKGSSEL